MNTISDYFFLWWWIPHKVMVNIDQVSFVFRFVTVRTEAGGGYLKLCRSWNKVFRFGFCTVVERCEDKRDNKSSELNGNSKIFDLKFDKLSNDERLTNLKAEF